MNRLITAVLAAILLTSLGFSQDDEPQLEAFEREHLPAEGFFPQMPLTLLDCAGAALDDLDLVSADLALAQYVAERPDDPRGPALQAASTLLELLRKETASETAWSRFDSLADRAAHLASQSLLRNEFDPHAASALALVRHLRELGSAWCTREGAAPLPKHYFSLMTFLQRPGYSPLVPNPQTETRKDEKGEAERFAVGDPAGRQGERARQCLAAEPDQPSASPSDQVGHLLVSPPANRLKAGRSTGGTSICKPY